MAKIEPAIVESLHAEIERLRAELAGFQAKKVRSDPIEFLGESLPRDLIPELAAGRKLSALAVRTLGAGYHGDGGNLYLQVTPGGRSWLFRYLWQGRQYEMGLGSVADVTLGEARGRAVICRRLKKSGVAPIDRKRELAARAATEAAEAAAMAIAATAKLVTFKEAAERYIEANKSGWKNPKHAAQWPSTLEAYVYPFLGKVSVKDVDTGLVLKVLEPIWASKPETAARVRGRVEAILDWARVRGYREGDNPARLRGHLEHSLPKRSKVQQVEHHAAMPYREMHSFWTALSAFTSASAEALRLTALTACRTGEVIGATWDEIDLQQKAWTISGARMKAGRDHKIPLSEEALQVLQRTALLKADDNQHVFRGAKEGRGLSNMAMTELLKSTPWGGKATAHGLRSTFRDWAAERTTYPGEKVELSLAHTISNRVEAAYRRGDQLERRRRLMSDWATFVTTASVEGDNILKFEAVA